MIRIRVPQKVFALLLMLLLLPVAYVTGQTNGGSSYSIFNIGDLSGSVSGAGAGRAGIETAVPSSTTINTVNPAMWNTLRYVTLQTGLAFEQYQVSDANSSVYQNQTRVQNFSVGVPFSEKYGGTMGFSLHPYSVVNYRTLQQQEIPTAGDTTTPAMLTYQGTGGLSEAFVGTSLKPLEWLAVGGGGSFYFGSIENRTLIAFPEASFNPGTYVSKELYTGWGGRFGLELGPFEGLRLGAAVSTGSTLDRELINFSIFDESGLVDTVSNDTTTSTFALPPRFSFGASYHTGKFLISAEGSIQQWADHEEFTDARDNMRLAVGLDRIRSTSLNASGFDNWAFRFGLFMDQTYYQVGDQGIDAMGVTFGAGIPLNTFGGLNSTTAIDLGIELGMRGTTDNGLTQETYGKISFELAISELWFRSARRSTETDDE